MSLRDELYKERSSGAAFIVFAMAFGYGATAPDAPWQLWIVSCVFAVIGALSLWAESK